MSTEDDALKRRRLAYKLAKEISLTREERMDLAEYVLRRDVKSWKDLDDAQICRLLDCMQGYEYIDVLLSMRPPLRAQEVDDGV